MDSGEKEVNLTVRDRGLAVAEQGQTSLGYMFMHGAALRAASELTAGLGLATYTPLMKINEASTPHLSQKQAHFHHDANTHFSFSAP